MANCADLGLENSAERDEGGTWLTCFDPLLDLHKPTYVCWIQSEACSLYHSSLSKPREHMIVRGISAYIPLVLLAGVVLL